MQAAWHPRERECATAWALRGGAGVQQLQRRASRPGMANPWQTYSNRSACLQCAPRPLTALQPIASKHECGDDICWNACRTHGPAACRRARVARRMWRAGRHRPAHAGALCALPRAAHLSLSLLRHQTSGAQHGKTVLIQGKVAEQLLSGVVAARLLNAAARDLALPIPRVDAIKEVLLSRLYAPAIAPAHCLLFNVQYFTPAATAHNWEQLVPALGALGVDVGADVKSLIVNGGACGTHTWCPSSWFPSWHWRTDSDMVAEVLYEMRSCVQRALHPGRSAAAATPRAVSGRLGEQVREEGMPRSSKSEGSAKTKLQPPASGRGHTPRTPASRGSPGAAAQPQPQPQRQRRTQQPRAAQQAAQRGTAQQAAWAGAGQAEDPLVEAVQAVPAHAWASAVSAAAAAAAPTAAPTACTGLHDRPPLHLPACRSRACAPCRSPPAPPRCRSTCWPPWSPPWACPQTRQWSC